MATRLRRHEAFIAVRTLMDRGGWFLGGRANPSLAVKLLNVSLVLVVSSLFLYACFRHVDYHWNWRPLQPYWRHFLWGWLMTLGLSAAALVGSTVVGLALALAQRSRILPLRYFSVVYVALIRGTPLLVQVLILFYFIGEALQVENRYLVGIVALSLFSGAYISEMIRAGIESVGASQLESARAIGLTPGQTFRFVVAPQALKQTLPPLAGQFVSLIKDSSLLYVVGVSEFTHAAQNVNAFTYSTMESYIPLAFGYLLLTLPVAGVAHWLERRLSYDT